MGAREEGKQNLQQTLRQTPPRQRKGGGKWYDKNTNRHHQGKGADSELAKVTAGSEAEDAETEMDGRQAGREGRNN